MENPILLSRIHELRTDDTRCSRMGEDYLYIDVAEDVEVVRTLEAPVRFYGFALFLCRSGHASIEINLERYEIEANSLLVVDPSTLIRICSIDNVRGEILFISAPFLRDINFDLQALHQAMVINEKPSPILSFLDQEVECISAFLRMMDTNARCNGSSSPLSKNIARSLVSATFYQIMLFIQNHRENEKGTASAGAPVMSLRRLGYVHEFGRLVQKYYRRERSVTFYASKLFISPKYLSLLVKEATGRSAVSWIDEYVIMEAKNMLRFSGRNIQQITYDLNFPNQSSFGKYFKHLTGMSPTQYQKS